MATSLEYSQNGTYPHSEVYFNYSIVLARLLEATPGYTFRDLTDAYERSDFDLIVRFVFGLEKTAEVSDGQFDAALTCLGFLRSGMPVEDLTTNILSWR